MVPKEPDFLSGDSLKQVTGGILQGNEQDFDIFYDIYAPRLYRYLLVLTRGNEEATKDIHQESMIRVIRYMKLFDDEKYLWNWLISIVKSTLIDFFRRNNQPIPENFYESQSPIGNTETPLTPFLNDAMESLKEDDRKLIHSFYFDKMPQKQIAAEQGASQQAIAMKIMRIRKTMKNFILKAISNEKQ